MYIKADLKIYVYVRALILNPKNSRVVYPLVSEMFLYKHELLFKKNTNFTGE